MTFVGVKKQNLKIKKTVQKVFAKTEPDVSMFPGAAAAVATIGRTQSLTPAQVLKSMSGEGLTDFQKEITSGRTSIEKRISTASDYTTEGLLLTKAAESIKNSQERLKELVTSCLTSSFDSVQQLLSAVDKEIGRREGRVAADDMDDL